MGRLRSALSGRRGRVIIGILAVLLLAAFATFGWYTYRVWTELGPRPWANPTVILGHDGSTILEIYGDQWRPGEPITLEEIPEYVPNAFLAAEDVRFHSHFGIDPWGIGRAALANVKEGGVAQGGSTITQQVAKTRFLSADRTLRRKLLEVFVALAIEARLSKEDILGAYLNDVYLGHDEGSEILGIDEAARIYFDRAPGELTVAQAALLAAMVRAPNQEDLELLRARRDAVLNAMNEQEWLDESELATALEEPIEFSKGALPQPRHRYYLTALRSELVDVIGERRLRGGGLRIHTAWDETMQNAAADAVVGGVDRLRSRHSWLRNSEDPLQAALLSVDPTTGGVRALVGGVSYAKSQFNRARTMKRQPGSALKPFVYAAAIERGEITPATTLRDEPVEVELSPGDVWSPHNYDDQFRGEVTVRESLEKSLNVPVVRLTEEIGVGTVSESLKRFGIEGDLSETPAISLGVDEVSMWELVGAYTALPTLGRRAQLHFVQRVEDGDGDVIYEHDQDGEQVLEPSVAYLVHSMLRGVVERGTASSVGGRFGAVAGKTGTTSDYRDAWFVGYAPDLVTATWVGFDEGEPLRISSAAAALPIWSSYMAAVPHEKGEISPPEGVTIERIERRSGLRWREGCGAAIEEAFIAGTAPEQVCTPGARPEPEPEPFVEPPVISLETLRDWLRSSRQVLPEGPFSGEDEDERAEEPPPLDVTRQPSDDVLPTPVEPEERDEGEERDEEPPFRSEPPPLREIERPEPEEQQERDESDQRGRPDKPEKPDKPDKPAKEKKPDKPDKPDRDDRRGRPDGREGSSEKAVDEVDEVDEVDNPG